jgi:hypothetical protein
MKPYSGESTTSRIDRSSMNGKVMCGYQGWFAAEGDGSGRGWRHYPHRGQFQPGSCSIDLWPDVSALEPDEKYPTPFRHADGRVAHVFSSTNRKTVLRHFRWMKADPVLHRVIAKADIISPWTVGRHASLKQVEEHAQRRWRPDLDWCRERKKPLRLDSGKRTP